MIVTKEIAMRMPSSHRNTLPPNGIPLLSNGDRLKQPEFHRRYEAYPDDAKFELIGGIVYMSSPLRRRHSLYDGEMGRLLEAYHEATPGVEVLHNATTILGEESEPQPDLGLRILTAYGGQSRETEDDYVAGAPELLAEIAASSRAIDLHAKRDDYRATGVQEYIVVSIEQAELHWFDFQAGDSIRPNRQGISKSRVFPGLWIHVSSLLARDRKGALAILEQGLASRPHAAFVKRLQARRR
jgi:Putative restriction endonuclease